MVVYRFWERDDGEEGEWIQNIWGEEGMRVRVELCDGGDVGRGEMVEMGDMIDESGRFYEEREFGFVDLVVWEKSLLYEDVCEKVREIW